jgi:hypothetical protein
VKYLLVALCALAACSFNSKDFDKRACNADTDCRPDSSCVDGLCAQKTCQSAADCGATTSFECTNGMCVATSCAQVTDCPLGFDCVSGFCQVGCPDHDGDGAGFGSSCSGVQDCDDNDPAIAPGKTEGPRGDPSCTDGKDND